ncbi:hypothetical protein KHA80_22425 [Anaerobacillus sp. HL2]|nr:hypothetical protein KHA80_22425 [Anaerobacillus sp. HL2]
MIADEVIDISKMNEGCKRMNSTIDLMFWQVLVAYVFIIVLLIIVELKIEIKKLSFIQ